MKCHHGYTVPDPIEDWCPFGCSDTGTATQELTLIAGERDHYRRVNIKLIKVLADLCTYANGRLDKNVYSIPEYMDALKAIGEAIGYTGDQYDTLEYYRKAEGRT